MSPVGSMVNQLDDVIVVAATALAVAVSSPLILSGRFSCRRATTTFNSTGQVAIDAILGERPGAR